MGCCQQLQSSERGSSEVTQQPFNETYKREMLKSSKLTPIKFQIEGDQDKLEVQGEGLNREASICQFHDLQKTISVRDQVNIFPIQKTTMFSEPVILNFRRPSISSPSRPGKDKSSKNINQKFLQML